MEAQTTAPDLSGLYLPRYLQAEISSWSQSELDAWAAERRAIRALVREICTKRR